MTLNQLPKPGTTQIFRCGDVFHFEIEVNDTDFQPFLRTSLGSAHNERQGLISRTEHQTSASTNHWTDIALTKVNQTSYHIDLPLCEVGCFEAKVWYKSNNEAKPIWPSGDNVHIKVEPATTVAHNSVYVAFTRMFGPNKYKIANSKEDTEHLKALDAKGYHVIPPSGTFRDLKKELHHIINIMGFRIVQLLPIHPTPTTFARMGRFGSPYAVLDFFSVDPALAEFDKEATPLNQFVELVDEIHRLKGQVIIDIPVDHTGWGSHLQKEHPEYFVKDHKGQFVSPGAWGTVWEDLIKLDFDNIDVHKLMADIFLYWCHKGVDGFRCDAGYMIPLKAWKYIIAKVRDQFPNTIFLLEGLGGPMDITEELLSKASFSWAYSELFQNYSKDEVLNCIDNNIRVTKNKGCLSNFSETHDNNRLAQDSKKWSHMRNLLCALSSQSGAFGITNGVEFFATEKIDVHQASALNWGNNDNLIHLFQKINYLFRFHPAFNAKATIELLHDNNPNLIVIKRRSKCYKTLLVIININIDSTQNYTVAESMFDHISERWLNESIEIAPGTALCLSTREDKDSIDNSLIDILALQQGKEQLLKTYVHIKGNTALPTKFVSNKLCSFINNPSDFCTSLGLSFAEITFWDVKTDFERTVMCLSNGVLIIESKLDFDFCLTKKGIALDSHSALQKDNDEYFAIVTLPQNSTKETKWLTLTIKERTNVKTVTKVGKLALLPKENYLLFKQEYDIKEVKSKSLFALCTNSLSSMSYVNGLWGHYTSKYEGLLVANFDAEVPTDRTTLVSRIRCWIIYNDYSHEVSIDSQKLFASDGATQAYWSFKIPTGQGKYISLKIHLKLNSDSNSICLTFQRDNSLHDDDQLNSTLPVTLIVRPDIEYRSHHEVTKAFAGEESLFPESITEDQHGFTFDPYKEHQLHMHAPEAKFCLEPEWKYMCDLPVDQERGMDHATDLFSPGFFETELSDNVYITASIDRKDDKCIVPSCIPTLANHEDTLINSLRRFVVKRNDGKTILAGYPWFLDWGRDSLICLRGMITANMQEDVKQVLLTFAKFEEQGTLPNMIRGNNASNRDTSDAPLWLIIVVKEYIEKFNDHQFLNTKCTTKSLKGVIISIAENYIKGTTNGVIMDKESGLIYSPSHFTWMDTNYPAGSPREGYPIEIQAFWFASIAFIDSITDDPKWSELNTLTLESILLYYKLEDKDGLSDCLHTKGFAPARMSIKDNACRPNQLFMVTLGVIKQKGIIQKILKATQKLIIPGAIRSIDNAEVKPPLDILRDGHLLNDPSHPYWGHYTGDEDTRRKPAYHNGTAWSWPFFSYCEALYLYTGERTACLNLTMSAKLLIESGVINHMPEICDGDTPHLQKGCKAQAWSITEYYRVLKKIKN